MAVALIMDFPGGEREQYEEVIRRMELGGRMAAGGLAHVAGDHADGWRVIDVWEDMASFERFRDEQIAPHTQAVGLAPPRVRTIECDEFMEGDGDEPRFAQCVFLQGMDAEGFHAMDGKILPGGTRPAEVVWHVHGPVEGGFMVVDTWTSREARDRFIHDYVVPAMARAGISGPPPIEDLDVEAFMGAGTAAPA